MPMSALWSTPGDFLLWLLAVAVVAGLARLLMPWRLWGMLLSFWGVVLGLWGVVAHGSGAAFVIGVMSGIGLYLLSTNEKGAE